MRRLILRCGLSPGDIVMLTAAVRDLHLCHPGRFATDVRTVCPGLWENNPHLTSLRAEDPGVEEIDCSYPLIHRCNTAPYHCLHGFIEFLNQRLNLSIKPTAFKGDIHLSAQEKAWYSQVRELTRADIPFWIVAAGGKYDVTIKWWQTERYQAVVDHFRGRIQFVQVGALGHHHPKLEGVIDLRGQTDLRQLIRLVYHSQGVLCSVTALMHLTAAVEGSIPGIPNRPCVVIAGGREPAHWEAYPDHQFIHTNGALPCCGAGGCWKDRSFRLRDGDPRDRPANLCNDVRDGLPRCLDLITPEEVERRIELYFENRRIKYLTPWQKKAAARAVTATKENRYDQQPLNLHSAGMACERYIESIPECPQRHHGRGIVICAGGVRYLTGAWVCINMLRGLGCRLPIQVWHLGKDERDPRMERLLAPLGVACIDASHIRDQFPVRLLGGWQLKPYAILHSSFREVLLLDADNVPVRDPSFLFDTPQFRATGAIFWPDYPNRKPRKALPVWRSCGLRRKPEPEFESGQVVVDKERCWRALHLVLWFNENSDFYYQYLHGDKETFHLAFRKLNQPYSLIPTPVRTLAGTMCQHDFEGRRLFQHRNTDKWDLFLTNRKVAGFRFEGECRAFIRQLQQKWDGGLRARLNGRSVFIRPGTPGPVKIQAVMITCPERTRLRRRTLESLAASDARNIPLHVEMDRSQGRDYRRRQTRCAFNALRRGVASGADYILFLEDDLQFNRHLRHNLVHWQPLRSRNVALASLYNPGVPELACDLRNHARIVAPQAVFGSQAFLVSRAAAKLILRRWHRVTGMQDIKISRLAARTNQPICYHVPSLVQHIGSRSVWGGRFHQARDFDPLWKA